MRLVVVSPGYPPRAGGVELLVQRICTHLAARPGFEVEAWVHDYRAPSVSTTVVDGVVVRRFPSHGPERYPVSPALMRHVRRHAREHDLVHAHSFHSLASVAGAMAPADVPLVMTLHYHGVGHTPAARAMHLLYRPIAQRVLGRAAGVATVSDAEREVLAAHFPELMPRTVTIHNGVDATELAAAEPFADQPPTVLVLGRQEPYKRIETVIAAVDLVRRPVQLVILGEGPSAPSLRRAANASRDPGRVLLPGQVPIAERDRWLRTAAVVVSASEHEAFGLAPLEGVAAGATAVVSDIPAHRELARLAPPGTIRFADITPAALAAAVEDALELAPDGAPPRPVRDWADVAEDHARWYRGFVEG